MFIILKFYVLINQISYSEVFRNRETVPENCLKYFGLFG